MPVNAPDKSDGSKTMAMTSGGSSGDSRGGSSRMYPKSGATMRAIPDTDNAPFNPQKVPATTKYVGGV
jgi:hypothetical protein